MKRKKGFFSKIFRQGSIKKGNTEAKESFSKEGGSDAASTSDYVDLENETISVSTIQGLYDNSNLLKKYIKVITDECLRYKFTARPKRGFENNTQSKARAASINDLFLKCNAFETFSEVREKYIKDLYLYGTAGLEIEPTTVDDAEALYAVPGYCIRLDVDETGANFINDKEAFKIVDPNDTERVIATFPTDSFIYFVLDKMSDRVYGSQPLQSIYSELKSDITSAKNIMAGTNTIKSGVICLPKAPKKLLKDIVDRLTMLTKRQSRTKIVAANSDGKFLDLSNLDAKDNIELQKWLVAKANIFNIPLFKLGMSDGGSLNAREQRDDFRATIESIVHYELNKLNAILIKEKFKFEDVEIVTPDLATKLSYERTRIAVRLVNGRIITPNEARKVYLDMDELDDPNANRLQVPVSEAENPEKVEDKKEK